MLLQKRVSLTKCTNWRRRQIEILRTRSSRSPDAFVAIVAIVFKNQIIKSNNYWKLFDMKWKLHNWSTFQRQRKSMVFHHPFPDLCLWAVASVNYVTTLDEVHVRVLNKSCPRVLLSLVSLTSLVWLPSSRRRGPQRRVGHEVRIARRRALPTCHAQYTHTDARRLRFFFQFWEFGIPWPFVFFMLVLIV